MAVTQSTRLQVYEWSEDTDEFTRAQMNTSHENLESYAAKLTTGTSLPAVSSAYNRSFFFKTDTDKLYFYDSSDASGDWREITLDPSINKSIFTGAGQILYSSGSATPVVLAAGTSGQFLTTSGTTLSWTSAVVTPTGTQTLTNKTLTSPMINTPTVVQPVLSRAIESWTYATTAPSGALALDLAVSTSYFYNNTTGSSGTWTPTFSNITSLLDANNEALTVAVINRVSSNAAFAANISITGASTTTLLWQGGVTPSSSNTSAGTDAYIYTIVRTAPNVYTVFASRTRFA
jgi:hypothetical protein